MLSMCCKLEGVTYEMGPSSSHAGLRLSWEVDSAGLGSGKLRPGFTMVFGAQSVVLSPRNSSVVFSPCNSFLLCLAASSRPLFGFIQTGR